MSAILDPPFRKMEIRCQIRNQRPQKPWSTKFHENRWVSKILCPPYWVRYSEFRKSDSNSDEFCGNHVVSKIACPTYWISAILRKVYLFEIGETIFILQFNYFDHR